MRGTSTNTLVGKKINEEGQNEANEEEEEEEEDWYTCPQFRENK